MSPVKFLDWRSVFGKPQQIQSGDFGIGFAKVEPVAVVMSLGGELRWQRNLWILCLPSRLKTKEPTQRTRPLDCLWLFQTVHDKEVTVGCE